MFLLDNILNIADFLWSNIIGYVLLGVGLFYTLRLGFPQIKYAKDIKDVLKKNLKSDDNVSGFGALAAAVGGQVGTGSLVGVASALVAGGPGAIFWMWITSILGMVITFAETVLGQVYRVKLSDGTYRGGPAYYIRNGLGKKVLGIITAFLYIIGVGLCIAFMQTNSIAKGFQGVIEFNPIIVGVVVTMLAGIITIGGVKRLTKVTGYLVPIMAAFYVLIVFVIIITNITKLPSVIALIFKSAFSAQAAVGGIIGHSIMDAFRNGVARGLFSNDAGNGIAGIMHSSADVDHPAEQGFLGMFGTFVTTCIICSLTAFAILLTGVLGNGSDGINLVQDAFSAQIGYIGRWIVALSMAFFGFTTLIADLFYGEANIIHIFKDKYKIPLWIYRIFAATMFIVSTKMSLDIVWGLIDVFVGILVFINVITLVFLFKSVKVVLDDYEDQKQAGKKPVWDKENNSLYTDQGDYNNFKI